MNDKPAVAVVGAGSIGCYLGGRLQATGTAVRFIGRERIRDMLHRHGLHLTDWQGADHRVAAETVDFHTALAAADAAPVLLVTVKSGATEAVARELAQVLTAPKCVISLQNGLHNARVLREHLPAQHTVVAGMVPFNVVERGQGAFHHGSEGALEVADDAAVEAVAESFARAGLALTRHADMEAVLWAKLLLNLNNAVNALSGLPLKAELSQRAYRRCVAMAQRETLTLLRSAGIQPAKLTPLPPHWLPAALDVPDWLFRLLGNRMLAIDPLARSSMWEDLERGRRTEIDWINGEVLDLADRLGQVAPVNARLVALIRDAEAGGRRDFSGDELLASLRSAASGVR